MLSMYSKIILFLAIAVATFGFISPWMLSYDSDEMVISGIIFMIIVIPIEVFIIIRILYDFQKVRQNVSKIGKRILKGVKK